MNPSEGKPSDNLQRSLKTTKAEQNFSSKNKKKKKMKNAYVYIIIIESLYIVSTRTNDEIMNNPNVNF